MVDKILKMTMKSLTEENTLKDIVDNVFDLKQKVVDLEQIAREFSKRKENYMEAKSVDYNKDTEIPIQTNHHIIQYSRFNIYSYLVIHFIIKHNDGNKI